MTGFRARARAVDMLGRQQIANLPTALSELFKNAHDAYATTAKAEYFRSAGLLVVHDDGVGMSRETFEEKWLTIATESKLAGYHDEVAPPDGMTRRTALGSKGIGRLAVGALGSQTLIVSKHRGHKPMAALVNWDMFDLPGIDLDQVPVGLVTLDSPALRPADMGNLKAPLLRTVADLRLRRSDSRWQSRLDGIQSEVSAFPDDPYQLIDRAAAIGSGASGTHIFICPVADDLASDISPGRSGASMLDETLHGFTDEWLGRGRTSILDFDVDFLDHRPGGDSESLLRAEDFFSQEDLARADHEIDGRFDRSGRFRGVIRIYDNDVREVEIESPLVSAPMCGPFDFRMATVQGLGSESRLDPEAFADISRRMKQLGGLYVYKDGIRVQPYGRPDVDYLGIEERRTFGAAYYYFSYRRIFGAVNLTTEANSALKEKAGREGLSQNRPFRDFRELLINLFIQLAVDYFRSGGEHVQMYSQGRQRLKAQDKARKTRDRKMAARRGAFTRKLTAAAAFLDHTDMGAEMRSIVDRAEKAASEATGVHTASRELSECRSRLRKVLSPLRINDPEGFALTRQMRRDLAMVNRERDRIESAYVTPTLKRIAILGRSAESRLTVRQSDVEKRKARVENLLKDATAAITDLEEKCQAAVEELRRAASDRVGGTADTARSRLSALKQPDAQRSEGWLEAEAQFRDRVSAVQEDASRYLGRLRSFAVDCSAALPDPSSGSVGQAEAADAEIMELRARADDQLELVQLGMALAVVDHEFHAMVRNIRRDVRRVGAWAAKNPPMRSLYADLRRDFEHLDTYLTLLTPMQRRIRGSKTEIRGVDIHRFLSQLFSERLSDTSVRLSASDDFKDFIVVGFASTFYPVFVNLIDNSLYWLDAADSPDPRSILLDASGSSMVIEDNGPGVDPTIAEEIFDFGFSTRPGGRGLGLAIADQILDRAGWRIRFEPRGQGTRFVLSPKPVNR